MGMFDFPLCCSLAWWRKNNNPMKGELGKRRKTLNPKLWNKARNSSLLEGLEENKTDAISSRSKRQTKPSEQSDGGRTFVTHQQWIHYSPDKIRRPTFGESKLKFHFSFTSKTKVTGESPPFIEQHFSRNASTDNILSFHTEKRSFFFSLESSFHCGLKSFELF